MHYSVHQIKEFDEIRKFFSEGKADRYNWLLLSTSGVHGTYTSLDEIDEFWDVTDEDDHNHVGRNITVLIIQPRLVTLYYGSVKINTLEEIRYLRNLVISTLEQINESQKGNMYGWTQKH